MKRIRGKYSKDSNFITVFCENKIYTLPKNSGRWGCREVGEMTAMGFPLTQEVYDSLEGKETEYGSFELGNGWWRCSR